MKKTNIKKSSAKTQSKAPKVVKKVVEPTKTLVEELESMEQTTGKDYIQKTKELEDILGIKETNPFKTSNANLFQENFVDVFPSITESGEGLTGKSNNKNLENMFKMLYLKQ